MLRTIILASLFISNVVLGDELPNELFNIQLMSNVSSLDGEISKGKGIVRIKGISYRYYSVDNKHYSTNGKFQSILVQAKEDNGEISSVIGQSKMGKDECLQSIDNYKVIIEKQYSINFPERKNSPYYLLTENNKMFMLGCEIKRKSILKLILAKI